MTERHTVELTAEKIGLIRESLDYSARAIRDYDYAPLDHEQASELRREKLALIESTRAAFG